MICLRLLSPILLWGSVAESGAGKDLSVCEALVGRWGYTVSGDSWVCMPTSVLPRCGPRPAASGSPGNLPGGDSWAPPQALQTFRTSEMRPSSLCIEKPWRGFWRSLLFDNHWLIWSQECCKYGVGGHPFCGLLCESPRGWFQILEQFCPDPSCPDPHPGLWGYRERDLTFIKHVLVLSAMHW